MRVPQILVPAGDSGHGLPTDIRRASVHRKIMEDPGSVEVLVDYSPPDLPSSPDLPRKSPALPQVSRGCPAGPARVHTDGIAAPASTQRMTPGINPWADAIRRAVS